MKHELLLVQFCFPIRLGSAREEYLDTRLQHKHLTVVADDDIDTITITSSRSTEVTRVPYTNVASTVVGKELGSSKPEVPALKSQPRKQPGPSND